MKVKVTDQKSARTTLTLQPIASDVPYHESFSEVMYLICHVVIRSNTGHASFLNAPCGAVDLVTGGTNTIDRWIFYFEIKNPGFASLVMEMMWKTQQFGHDGLLQLTYVGKAQVGTTSGGAGATVAGTVYGGTRGPPYHDVIHAGKSYWKDSSTGKPVVFYPNTNETARFKMLVAGGGDNTTLDGSAVFLEFRPTVWLTMFYNRQATPEFSVLPKS
jgi:hypothetical protein